jgi:hypothetical protein
VLWTVLSQTDFGHDWLLRFVLACVLGALFVHFLSAEGMRSLWLKTGPTLTHHGPGGAILSRCTVLAQTRLVASFSREGIEVHETAGICRAHQPTWRFLKVLASIVKSDFHFLFC